MTQRDYARFIGSLRGFDRSRPRLARTVQRSPRNLRPGEAPMRLVARKSNLGKAFCMSNDVHGLVGQVEDRERG